MIKLALAALLYAGACAAQAVPLTLGFSGTITYSYDGKTLKTGLYDNTAFSGSLTFDLANAVPRAVTSGSTTGFEARTQSGCYTLVNGICQGQNLPSTKPVVLSATLTGAFGTVSLSPTPNTTYASTTVAHYRNADGATWAGYAIQNGFQSTNANGWEDLDQSFSLSLLSWTQNIFTNFNDLTELVRLDTTDIARFNYQDSDCARSSWFESCRYTLPNRSPLSLQGNLARLYWIDGPKAPADVPEPGTLALLGSGMLGLAWRRARAKRS